jgi:transcription antitermination factor NusA-like protein
VPPRKEQSRVTRLASRSVIGAEPERERPQIVLSRTDPALLIKLFEQEVPETARSVVIRGAVREAAIAQRWRLRARRRWWGAPA